MMYGFLSISGPSSRHQLRKHQHRRSDAGAVRSARAGWCWLCFLVQSRGRKLPIRDIARRKADRQRLTANPATAGRAMVADDAPRCRMAPTCARRRWTIRDLIMVIKCGLPGTSTGV
jgi:hypothetical protein